MRAPLRPPVVCLLLMLIARPSGAQIPLFISGAAGAAFDVGANNPTSGGGFSYQAELGLHLHRLMPGAEFAEHRTGGGQVARFRGAFVRLPATTTGQARPYLVVGLGDYRYSLNAARKNHALGGNAGLGVYFPVGEHLTGLVLEARYHSAFNGLGSIAGRDFASVDAGVQIGF